MSIKPVFPTIPRNSMARQQHSRYPALFMDRTFTVRQLDGDSNVALRGVSCENYVFCSITVPIGMRVIVTRVSYCVVLSGNIYPRPVDRVFLRNRSRETSRFDYDRFTPIPVTEPAPEFGTGDLQSSYPNPETVDVYDFGNSGDTLIYGVNGFVIDGTDPSPPPAPLMSPTSFVEVDYLLVPPNRDIYTNAQDEETR
jgi:hypothetical protein